MKESTPCVFFSWSGERSQRVAEEFRELFKGVFAPTIDCFVSSRDIAAGARSIQTLFEKLEKCNYGICFVDSENAKAPWMHFEAGALSKMVADSRVMVLLLDNNTERLQGTPLFEFQHKLFNKEHIKSIFEEIVEAFEQGNIKDQYLKRFEDGWNTFNENSNKILTNVQNEDDVQSIEGNELNAIKKMLVDVQNLLKTEYGQNVRESVGLVNELKKIMLNMVPDDLKDMKMRFKVQRYELIFQQNVQNIEEIIDNVENDSNYSTEELVEKLNKIIGRTMSLLED